MPCSSGSNRRTFGIRTNQHPGWIPHGHERPDCEDSSTQHLWPHLGSLPFPTAPPIRRRPMSLCEQKVRSLLFCSGNPPTQTVYSILCVFWGFGQLAGYVYMCRRCVTYISGTIAGSPFFSRFATAISSRSLGISRARRFYPSALSASCTHNYIRKKERKKEMITSSYRS